MRLFLGLAFAALLAACATVPAGIHLVAQSKRELDESSVCCMTLAEAKRTRLPIEKTQVVLDKTAQVFDFGGTKAFFVLYELPAYSKPYSIQITSVPSGGLNDTALLIPRITIYDDDFKPTRFFDEKTLRNRGNTLERTVFINPQNIHERSIAIFGSDLSASIERTYSMVTVTPIVAGPLIFNMYGGHDGKSTLRSSPTGILQLEVQGLSVESAPK